MMDALSANVVPFDPVAKIQMNIRLFVHPLASIIELS